MQVQIKITQVINNQIKDFYALFEKQSFENVLQQRFLNDYLYVVSENHKRIIPFENLSNNGLFESFHLFSYFRIDQSYFFDGLNKYIFKGIKENPFERVKEYAEAIEETV